MTYMYTFITPRPDSFEQAKCVRCIYFDIKWQLFYHPAAKQFEEEINLRAVYKPRLYKVFINIFGRSQFVNFLPIRESQVDFQVS